MNTTRIDIAVIGLGHWGPNIVGALFSNLNIGQVYVFDGDITRVRLMQERFPQVISVTSFEEILNNSEIKAVIVATPTITHFKIGSQILKHKKHLLIEKPITDNITSSEMLIKLANDNKLILMTGHIFLFNNAIVKMKEMISSGEIGNILYARSVRSNLGPIRQDVNALWDLASHDLSIFDYFFNETPYRVSCNTFSPLGLKQSDMALGTLDYQKNAATFFVSWLDPLKTRKITVVGERKMLVFDDMQPDSPLKIYDRGVKLMQNPAYSDSFNSFRMSIHNGAEESIDITTGQPLKNECDHFIDCIINSKQPVSDGECGLRVVKILEKLEQSSALHGAPIYI